MELKIRQSWYKCPECGKSSLVQRTTRFSQASNEARSRAHKRNWAGHRAILERAAAAGHSVDPARAGPRSSQSKYLQQLWVLSFYGRQGQRPSFFDFDPWGEHRPDDEVFKHVFGRTPGDRYEGQKMFGRDFDAEDRTYSN